MASDNKTGKPAMTNGERIFKFLLRRSGNKFSTQAIAEHTGVPLTSVKNGVLRYNAHARRRGWKEIQSQMGRNGGFWVMS